MYRALDFAKITESLHQINPDYWWTKQSQMIPASSEPGIILDTTRMHN